MGKIYAYNSKGELISESEDSAVEQPNWLGLEQDLRYSSVFGRRKEVDPVDFNIFTTTLVNGKLGHASENALAFGFSILGLDWTSEETELINGLLQKHNFAFRLNSNARTVRWVNIEAEMAAALKEEKYNKKGWFVRFINWIKSLFKNGKTKKHS